MPTSELLRRRLSSLERIESELILWRGVAGSYEALSTRGARIRGGRWNPPGLAALYASFEIVTVRAELARGAERRLQVEEARYPITLVQIRVNARVIDLTSPERLESLGIEVPFSILTPVEQSRRIGAAAAALGVDGVSVPSVVTRGHNAVLFPENLSAPIEVASKRRVAAPSRWPVGPHQR